MNYVSTRGETRSHQFEEVVLAGSAPDGGLFRPVEIPTVSLKGPFQGHEFYLAMALEAFGASDTSELAADAVAEFHHPDIAPLTDVGDRKLLELYWGPTLSFKDHALQVLARLIDRYSAGSGSSSTVLVATSGDTGSAAIEAFRGRESVDIIVLYPDGLVTDFQRRQMTTVPDDNVRVVSVRGTFDDCQRMIKEAFTMIDGLVSANSINWGRVASQVGYYLSTAARIGEFDVTIPTGNFGNAYAAWTARRMGVPIRRITLANNANHGLVDLHRTGEFPSSDVVPTLAPAMDIQVPSNLERYLDEREPAHFYEDFEAGWADDVSIVETIAKVYETTGTVLDPHTAAAWSVASDSDEVPSVVVATAHPAKFESAIERALGFTPDVPEWAVIDDSRVERKLEIEADVDQLLGIL
jgi:threonine synthase